MAVSKYHQNYSNIILRYVISYIGIVIVILSVIVCVVIKKQNKNGQENNQGLRLNNFNIYRNQGAEINIDGSDCNHRSL